VQRGTALAILAIAALVLAGCAGKPSIGVSTDAPSTTSSTPVPVTVANVTRAPLTGLETLGDPVPVSVPGHRTSEFTVAHDPAHPLRLLAAGMDWDSKDATVQCAAFPSTDGGKTWSQVQALPGHASTKEDTDPWVAFDGIGTAYLTCTEGGVGILLGNSTDGGATWGTARLIPTGGLPIKGAIGAFGDGELYVCFQQGNKLQVVHSTDHGASWSQFGFGDLSAGCNGVQKSPAGAIHILWQSGGQLEADNLNPAPPGVGLATSQDGGQHWSVTHIQDELGAAPANMPSAPQAAAPTFAVSPRTGHILVGAQQYQNAEVAGGVGSSTSAAALYWRSTDQGATFQSLTGPKFPSEECAACNTVHPTLAVDANGTYFLQVTLSTSDSAHKEVWFTASADEGDSWLTPVHLALYDPLPVQPTNAVPDPGGVAQDVQDVSGDPADAPAVATARADQMTWPVFHRDGGEYFGISATPTGAVGLWVQPDADGKNTILSRTIGTVTT